MSDQPAHAIVGAGGQEADGDLAGDGIDQVKVEDRAAGAGDVGGVGAASAGLSCKGAITAAADAAITGRGHARDPDG